MATLDLKLLAIIDELYRTRSVSQTAENLGLNQPSVSMSLARLRKHFDDPLFVKANQRMEPTAHAMEIIDRLRQAHSLIREASEYRKVFNPTTSTRTFRIASTDIGQVVLLPTLMKHLGDSAPRVGLEFSNFSASSLGQLEAGEMDLAVGFIPPLRSGFLRQKLFTERFVCVVRAGHPRVRKRLTLDAFERELHLVVMTSGTGHVVVEKTLEEKGIQRRIGLRVPSFLGLATLIALTDLMVTVPERLALVMASRANIQVLPPPFDVPTYSVMQYWHARAHRDPANQWLRRSIAELFGDAPRPLTRGRQR